MYDRQFAYSCDEAKARGRLAGSMKAMRPLLRGDSRVRHAFVAVTVEGKGI